MNRPELTASCFMKLRTLIMVTISGACLVLGVSGYIEASPVGSLPASLGQGIIFSNIAVERYGTYAVISFTTSRPLNAGVEYALEGVAIAELMPGVPSVLPLPLGSLPLPSVRQPSGVLSGFTGLVSPLETSHTVRLNNLQSNTTYWFRIWAQDAGGAVVQSVPMEFETLKRRLMITFEAAHIFDSGDFFGDGEPTWFFTVSWDNRSAAGPRSFSVNSCFPYTADPPDSQGYARALCLAGDTGDASTITDPDGGRVLPFYTPTHQPLSYIFAEENFVFNGGLPEHITICGAAKEDDSGFGIFDTLAHIIASFPTAFDASGINCSVQWDVLTPTAEHARLTANDTPDAGFRSDVIVRLQEYYDDLVYQGYTDGGGLVVSTFPVVSNVHIAHIPH